MKQPNYRGALRAMIGCGLGLALWVPTALQAGGTNTANAWDAYNAGVRFYADRDYTAALEAWENLSVQPLPGGLRRPVRFQLGDVHFRLGEAREVNAPEEAAELWRRSCEDFRSALSEKPRDAASRHNLALVQARLARLLHQLGTELLREAESKPVDTAIDLLRASTDDLTEAVGLAPGTPEFQADRVRAQKDLRDRLATRAGTAEAQADDAAQQVSTWSEQTAEERYRAALQDLDDASRAAAAASTPSPQPRESPADPDIAQAQARVTTKLAALLARMGKREQKEGNEQAESNPEDALGHYETALDHFMQAQQVQSGNEAGRRGEREVRAAMEKLHVNEGGAELRHGRDALAQKSPRAAPALQSALSHFEAATELNPANDEARTGAEEARRLLPEALALAGEAELQAGERAEPQLATEALNHYQESEKSFAEALDLKPGMGRAQKGLQEVQPRLERLRQRVAREAAQAAERNAAPDGKPATLDSLLGQVDRRERVGDIDRQRQRAQNKPGGRRTYPDW